MRKWFAKLMCRWGIHRPMKEICYSFTDVVNGVHVFECRCSCGREWLAQPGALSFRVEKRASKRKRGVPDDD